MNDDERFVVGSGNVYADLGYEDPEGAQQKADLAIDIILAMRAQGLTQQQAAGLMGTSQAQVSHIVRGRLRGITLDALTRYLRSLGADVNIQVTLPTPTIATPPQKPAPFQGYGDTRHHLPMAADGKAKKKADFS